MSYKIVPTNQLSDKQKQILDSQNEINELEYRDSKSFLDELKKEYEL